MKKIYSLIAVLFLMLSSSSFVNAQCNGSRYHNYVFPSYTLTSNVSYGSNVKYNNTTQNLLMDIYEPQGDVDTSRPVVIIAHGGSFYTGSKTGTDVVPLCKDLAKLGYVAVSIEYRLGMTNFPFTQTHQVDSTDAGAAVMRAVHDGRAAVRFLRKNAAIGGNTYKIDTNNIFFGGVSAGGFIALHIAYMDTITEFPSYVDTVGQYGLHGGIEGLSGSQGYSSNVKAVVNICGALGDTAWMHPGDEPVLSLHGNNDNTVPYGSALIYLAGTYPLLEVDGSFSVAARASAEGIENCFKTYYNQDHTPEVGTTANAIAYYDTTIVITRNFLEHQVCGALLDCNYTAAIQTSALGINDEKQVNQIAIYPNPAGTYFTIGLAAFTEEKISIEMYDSLGKKVKSTTTDKNDRAVINCDGLPRGIYIISVSSGKHHFSKKIVLE